MPNSRQVAARALAKCQANDPYFPNVGDAMVLAWSEHLERHGILDYELVEAAVFKMYDEHDSGFRPLPKDLVAAARSIRKTVTEDETEREKNLRIAANEERLGLSMDQRTFPSGVPSEAELLAITGSDERRRAIEQFVGHMAGRAERLPQVDTRRETVAEKVARIRAESPPQPLGPTDEPKVAEDGAQPQESAL